MNEHVPELSEGVCRCGRKLICVLGVMMPWCKKGRLRDVSSLTVRCKRCSGLGNRRKLHRYHLSEEDVAWDADGVAWHVECGSTVLAEVGGWTKELRATCQGCGDPLKGRQTTWCSRALVDASGRRWPKACFAAWHTPAYLFRSLADIQHGLCGICLGLLSEPRRSSDKPLLLAKSSRGMQDGEVDHVIPLAAQGPRTVENLRATHHACNQAKKDKNLHVVRARMGISPWEIEQRLAGLPADIAEMLKAV